MDRCPPETIESMESADGQLFHASPCSSSVGFHGHESTTAQTHDWITPKPIIDALGPFDLDPCASLCQPWATARDQYTVEDDGLSKEWRGHVWLNPPYGKQASEWINRLADHGDGIALIFARTDTKWFQAVATKSSAMLFLAGRVRFHDTRGGKFKRDGGGSSATSPSVLIAFGDKAKRTLSRRPLDGIFFETNAEVCHGANNE